MTKLIYHKFHPNSDPATDYLVRNGEDISHPVSIVEVIKEIHWVLEQFMKNPEAGKVTVSFEDDRDEPRTHRTVKDLIDEAETVAKSIPAMRISKKTIPGYSSAPVWDISFEDNAYTAEARGAAHLVEEVKEAKGYYEALQELEKKEEADAIRLEEEEKEIIPDGKAIHADSLDRSVRELLVHFIENLTIGKAVDILADGNYPHIALDELYDIGIQLRLSLERDEW